MQVEFDPPSPDEQPEDVLAGPVAHRRRSITIASAVVAAVLLAGGAVAIAQDSSSSRNAVGSALAAATTSTSPSSHPSGRGQHGPLDQKDMKPVLFGTVKSSSGDNILITDFQGFTRTIVTSSKTVYKNGLTATPKAGTKIAAQGTVDSGGTSLDATLISTWPAFGGPRGGHPPFGGRFAGPGPHSGSLPSGSRPSGFPTGSRPSGYPTGSRPSGYPTGHPGGGKPPAKPGAPSSGATS
jgi:hypothetical protein